MEAYKKILIDSEPGTALTIIADQKDQRIPWSLRANKINEGDIVFKVRDRGNRMLCQTTDRVRLIIPYEWLTCQTIEVTKKLLGRPDPDWALKSAKTAFNNSEFNQKLMQKVPNYKAMEVINALHTFRDLGAFLYNAKK